MSYLVLARKYRPKTFDEVIGQETIATTLKNAVSSGRVAHAYLFTGPRGVGKTSMARILAKALNCVKGPTTEPCNKCEICNHVDAGDDVDVVEIDAASNRGIDDIRSLRENARYTPARARHKIYVIDEVHMLTKEAFNSLLKTLEEPPPHVKFIFATTEPQKVLDTIKSRCQRFDFHRIPTAQIAKHLESLCKQEKIKTDDGVLDAIARGSHGGMRDAESTLDQLASLTQGKITAQDFEELTGAISQDVLIKIAEAAASNNPAAAIELLNKVFAKGAAEDEFIGQLIDLWRDLLITKIAGEDNGLVDRGETERKALAGIAPKFTKDALIYLVQMFSDTKQKIKDSSQSRIVIEMSLIKAAEVHDLRPLEEILRELRQIEAQKNKAGQGGGQVSPRPSAPQSESHPRQTQFFRPATGAQQADESPKPAPVKKTGDVWQDAMELIQHRRKGLADFLASVTAVEREIAGGITFVITADKFTVAQIRPGKKVIEEAISEVSGKHAVVELVEQAAAPQPQAAKTAEEPTSENVQKAAKFFGAKVVRKFKEPVREPDSVEDSQ